MARPALQTTQKEWVLKARLQAAFAVMIFAFIYSTSWAGVTQDQQGEGRSTLPSREDAIAELVSLVTWQINDIQSHVTIDADDPEARSAKEQDTEAIGVANNTIQRLAELGSQDAAERVAEISAEAFRDVEPSVLDATSAFNLAEIFRHAGEPALARGALRSALNNLENQSSDDVSNEEAVNRFLAQEIRVSIAQSYRELGDTDAALDVLRTELRSDRPYHPLLLTARSRAARQLAVYGSPQEALFLLHSDLRSAAGSQPHRLETVINPIPDTLVILGLIGSEDAHIAREAILRSSFLTIGRIEMRMAEARIYEVSDLDLLAKEALLASVSDLLESDNIAQWDVQTRALGAATSRYGMCDLSLALRDLARTAVELNALRGVGIPDIQSSMPYLAATSRLLHLVAIEANCGSAYEAARFVWQELQNEPVLQPIEEAIIEFDDQDPWMFAVGAWISSIETSIIPDRHGAFLRAISATIPVSRVMSQTTWNFRNVNEFALTRIWVEGAYLSGRRHVAEDVTLAAYRSLPAGPAERIDALVEMMPLFR